MIIIPRDQLLGSHPTGQTFSPRRFQSIALSTTPVRSTGTHAVSPSARALTGRASDRLSPSFLLGIVALSRIMPMLCHRQNYQRPEIPTRNHTGVWRSPSYTTDRVDAVRPRWGEAWVPPIAVRVFRRGIPSLEEPTKMFVARNEVGNGLRTAKRGNNDECDATRASRVDEPIFVFGGGFAP